MKEVSDNNSGKIINISGYVPPKVRTKQWRALIQKVWEVDPLECPSCGGEMKIISFIQEQTAIEKILRHLGLWTKSTAVEQLPRGSPTELDKQEPTITYEPFYDDWPKQGIEVLN